MKKQIWVAAAALLAAGAATAQSVTMYGILDVGYGAAKGTKFGMSNGKPGGSQSYHTPSRIGLRGTEDMGGGLKANFNLESSGIGMDTGEVPGSLWGREAWVGLSGTWGATRMGRTASFGTQGHARYDLNGISQSSAMDNAGISPVTWYGSSRRSSVFQYVTPNFGGFEGGVGYTFGADNGGQGATQARVNYDNGPLSVGYVGETKRNATSRTAHAVAGSYDFKVVKAVAGWVRSETAAKGKGFYVGAQAPIGPVTLGFQHARNTTTDINATELFANYALSKRTRLYADYVRKTGGLYSYGLGVLHAF